MLPVPNEVKVDFAEWYQLECDQNENDEGAEEVIPLDEHEPNRGFSEMMSTPREWWRFTTSVCPGPVLRCLEGVWSRWVGTVGCFLQAQLIGGVRR